jgi:uncharacterized protein involved in exopolysaccharide biosynthesis
VETQVEILKSENISLAVIRDLHLIEDPEFTGSGGGVLGAFFDRGQRVRPVHLGFALAQQVQVRAVE